MLVRGPTAGPAPRTSVPRSCCLLAGTFAGLLLAGVVTWRLLAHRLGLPARRPRAGEQLRDGDPDAGDDAVEPGSRPRSVSWASLRRPRRRRAAAGPSGQASGSARPEPRRSRCATLAAGPTPRRWSSSASCGGGAPRRAGPTTSCCSPSTSRWSRSAAAPVPPACPTRPPCWSAEEPSSSRSSAAAT